jgi:two-component system, NtrC family, response regulator AtoC
MGVMTIFLVEDDPIYGEFIQRALSRDPDYSITWFTTAEECLEVINAKGLPNAMIFDYQLPGMLGIELYEKLKPGFKPDQKCIIMSSIDDGNLVLSLIQRGVRDYVIKDENVVDSLIAILEGKEDEFLSF